MGGREAEPGGLLKRERRRRYLLGSRPTSARRLSRGREDHPTRSPTEPAARVTAVTHHSPRGAASKASSRRTTIGANLQLVVDRGRPTSTVGTWASCSENAVETVAKQNQARSSCSSDSPLMDANGTPIAPLQRAHRGVPRKRKAASVMRSRACLEGREDRLRGAAWKFPLSKKFEAGFRAGEDHQPGRPPKARAVHRQLRQRRARQTGRAGPSRKGCEVVFHAAGSDGNGVIQAIKGSARGRQGRLRHRRRQRPVTAPRARRGADLDGEASTSRWQAATTSPPHVQERRPRWG